MEVFVEDHELRVRAADEAAGQAELTVLDEHTIDENTKPLLVYREKKASA